MEKVASMNRIECDNNPARQFVQQVRDNIATFSKFVLNSGCLFQQTMANIRVCEIRNTVRVEQRGENRLTHARFHTKKLANHTSGHDRFVATTTSMSHAQSQTASSTSFFCPRSSASFAEFLSIQLSAFVKHTISFAAIFIVLVQNYSLSNITKKVNFILFFYFAVSRSFLSLHFDSAEIVFNHLNFRNVCVQNA